MRGRRGRLTKVRWLSRLRDMTAIVEVRRRYEYECHRNRVRVEGRAGADHAIDSNL